MRRTHLGHTVEAAREEALVGVVGVGGLVVGRHLSVVVLGVLHEVVRVHPAVEHQHVVARKQERVTLLHLTAADASANLLQITSGVATPRSACLPSHGHHTGAVLSVSVCVGCLRVRNASIDPILSPGHHLITSDFAGRGSSFHAALKVGRTITVVARVRRSTLSVT